MRTVLLLSDGTYVTKYENGGTYLQMAQSVKFAPFLFHVFRIQDQAGLCNMQTPSLKKLKVNLINITLTILKLSKNEILKEIFDIQPFDRKKLEPNNIYDFITTISLAYWIMGDGGRTGYGLH
jgi:hypothetical protein